MATLKHRPSGYVASGRCFQSKKISGEEDATKSVIDLLGEAILMYASDYPHEDGWFPISVEPVMGWRRIPERAKKKLFRDNPVNFYKRHGWG